MSDTVERIVIGTRGSELALVQAEMTEGLLGGCFGDLEVVRRIIKTTGDRRTDVSLAEVAKSEGTFDKGVFIKELEEALASGEVDLAVHSLKDMPTVVDERFELVAVLERAGVRDLLLTREPVGLMGLKAGARVGTSSVRRAKQVEFLRPDVEVVDLRGNVPTRIGKLAAGDGYDAILLAEAGLVRLGFISEDGGDEEVVGFPGIFCTRLAEDVFYPAAGQGAIGLEMRRGDERVRVFAEAIGHEATWRRVSAEREFLRLLDGGCHTPVGVYSRLVGDEILLAARVFPEEGGEPMAGEVRGKDGIAVARELYETLK